MAKLSANGTEFARFRKEFPQDEDGEVLVVEHSCRLKPTAEGAKLIVMRKRKWKRAGRWSPWKHIADGRTREGLLKWHYARDYQQVSGETLDTYLEEKGRALLLARRRLQPGGLGRG